jgi:hypothetical protein
MTQCERLLDYLKHYRKIDPFEAWQRLGIYRLGARIYDLKQQGHMIGKRTARVFNRYGEECRIAEYFLEGK